MLLQSPRCAEKLSGYERHAGSWESEQPRIGRLEVADWHFLLLAAARKECRRLQSVDQILRTTVMNNCDRNETGE
jgi:hypothetical protein